MQSNIVIGLDIGYSNVGVVVGGADSRPRCHVFPAGAGPASLMPERIGNDVREDAIPVVINGELWVAGVEPHRLQGWSRDLHKDYPASDTYQALFRAALRISDTPHIAHLVTGLPVSHYQNKGARQALIGRLRGSHAVDGVRRVAVEKVTVLPQPVGAYMDYLSQTHDLDLLEQGRILVVDPGFYSVDWVTIEAGEIRQASSGSSVNAMSVVLETADRLIGVRFGIHPGPQRLERVVRAGQQYVFLASEKVEGCASPKRLLNTPFDVPCSLTQVEM